MYDNVRFTVLAVLTIIFEEKPCPDMPIDDNPGVLSIL